MIVENDEKKHCPYCRSNRVKLAGYTKQKKQRYQCLSCKKTYLWKLEENVYKGKYTWFVLWMKEGFTIKQIAKIKKTNPRTVRRVISYWLSKNPPEQKISSNVKYLLFDGTYIEKRTGIYAAMDANTHKIIYGEYGVNESSKDLIYFYSLLVNKGLKPIAASIDGGQQQFMYLLKQWPYLTIQRCIIHVNRQGLSWLRANPKRIESLELREILRKIHYIDTYEKAEYFIKKFYEWEEKRGIKVQSSSNRGKVFSDLIRTRSMIMKALPYLFNYLADEKIAKSTNALEGYFSRLKEKYRRHRGLSKSKRKNYFSWYFYLIPR